MLYSSPKLWPLPPPAAYRIKSIMYKIIALHRIHLQAALPTLIHVSFWLYSGSVFTYLILQVLQSPYLVESTIF